MDVKSKALELVQKFTFARTDDNEKYVAKQCALIAVDEIIGELRELRKPEYTTFIIEYADPDVKGDLGKSMDGYEKIEYFLAVKEAIQNL